VVWAATWALNGAIGAGVPQDWASHMIGHELTALHGIDHARTLAVVVPSLINVQRATKGAKILQYGERVWGIRNGTEDERINQAIAHDPRLLRVARAEDPPRGLQRQALRRARLPGA
jgi:NADP-dependent alcohol dehydrogenase